MGWGERAVSAGLALSFVMVALSFWALTRAPAEIGYKPDIFPPGAAAR